MNLHVDLVGVRVEIEHDGLLQESILTVDSCCDLVQVLVNGLFEVQTVTLDAINMCFNVG